MNRGIITLVWGTATAGMILAGGIKTVNLSMQAKAAETRTVMPIKEEIVFSVPDYAQITRAEATLAELGVNVPDNIRYECEAAGSAFQVCPELLEAIAWKESRFNVNATASNGKNIGIMQIHKGVHADRLAVYGMDNYDIHAQVWAAAGLIRDLADKYSVEGEPADAGTIIAAYHGENNPMKETTSAYTDAVLEVSAALERAHGK